MPRRRHGPKPSRDAEGTLRAEEDAATREILEERGDYVGRVEDDGKGE